VELSIQVKTITGIERHNGDPLRLDFTKIGVLKQTNQIRLNSFLKSKNCVAL